MTKAERRAIRRRHAKASRSAIDHWLADDPPSLVLRPVNGGGDFELTPADDDGGFGDDDLLVAETAMASREGGTHAIHPRLLDLVYRAVRHFDAPYVYVISGYRPGRATSRHAHGRAMDFVLPGTTDRRLAAYVRRFGFVGVGIYPTSGFVHLDVRERSHFWSDSSGPREENRERPILRDLARRYDREARADGIEPTSDEEIELARAAERSAGEVTEGDGEGASGGEGEGGEAIEIEGEGVELESGELDAPEASPSSDAGLLDAAIPDAGLVDASRPDAGVAR